MTVDILSSVAIVLLGVGLVLQAMMSWSGGHRERARLADRLDALHDEVDAIAEHLRVSLPSVEELDRQRIGRDGEEAVGSDPGPTGEGRDRPGQP